METYHFMCYQINIQCHVHEGNSLSFNRGWLYTVLKTNLKHILGLDEADLLWFKKSKTNPLLSGEHR